MSDLSSSPNRIANILKITEPHEDDLLLLQQRELSVHAASFVELECVFNNTLTSSSCT